MHPVRRFLSIDTITSPSFTTEGGVLYLCDTTGTSQVWYRLDRHTDPERLTAESERISFVSASPTRAEFIFGMDQGSDEHDQLFRYQLETGEQTPLTVTPDAIHLWGGWSPDGDRFAFAANRRQSDTFDVYIQDRDGGPDDATLVYEGEGGFLSVEAWHPDGDRLCLSRARSSGAQDVYVCAIDDGSLTQINRTDDARYESFTFDGAGGLYCLTNQLDDNMALVRLSLSDGTATPIVDGDGWNIDHYAVDRSTNVLIYTRNVDGFSTLHVGEITPEDTVAIHTEPDIGSQVVSDLVRSPTGEQFAVAHSKRTAPHAIACGNTTPDTVLETIVAAGTLGIPQSTLRSPEVIRYTAADGIEIPAYWTLPNDATAGKTPVIVDIHGGPEHQRRPWFYPTKQFFLQQGYAVLEPNVRGSSGYGKAYTHLDDVEKRMDSVRDIKSAVEWLHKQPAVDPDRIIAYGRSYGGFMVLSAITEYPDLWRAAVEFVGIADFETFLENTGEWRRSHREHEYGSLETDRDVLKEISPIHAVEKIKCPLFIQHGANDPRVPVGEAEQIAAALASRDVPVETLIFPDEGHHTTDRTNLITQFEAIASFLEKHV